MVCILVKTQTEVWNWQPEVCKYNDTTPSISSGFVLVYQPRQIVDLEQRHDDMLLKSNQLIPTPAEGLDF